MRQKKFEESVNTQLRHSSLEGHAVGMSDMKGIPESGVHLTHPPPESTPLGNQRQASVDLGKESDFRHSDSGSIQRVFLLQSCTVYSPPKARVILFRPIPVHVTPLLKNPLVAPITHCMNPKFLTRTGKPQHNLAPGSLVSLISCPSSPLDFTAAHCPHLSSSNLPSTDPPQDLCFCCTLCQE